MSFIYNNLIMSLYPFEFSEISDSKNNPLMKKFIIELGLPLIYWYTVNFSQERITSLIMASNMPTCNIDDESLIEKFHEYVNKESIIVKHWIIEKQLSVKSFWKLRSDLAKQIDSKGSPLYVIFRNYEKVLVYNPISKIKQYLLWNEFAEFYKNLKSVKEQSKPMMYMETSMFEKHLRSYWVTGAWDMDWFILKDNKFVFYEFSTKNVTCEEIMLHNPNQYMNEDWRRWQAPMIFKKNIKNSIINVVIWSPCCKKFLRILNDVDLKNDNWSYKLEWNNEEKYQ